MLEQNIGIAIVIVYFIISLLSASPEGIHLATLALLILNILICRKYTKRKIFFLLFNLTYFIFLIGGSTISITFPWFNSPIIDPKFTEETKIFSNTLIFLSLVTVRIFFTIGFLNNIKNTNSEYTINSSSTDKLRKITKKIILPLLFVNLILVIEKILFVTSNGYLAYYTNYISAVPIIVARIGGLYEPILFLYLATLPKRRDVHLQLIIYFLFSSLSLGYGQRNGFVLGILFIFFYLGIRDVLTPESKPWLSRKIIWSSALLALPFVLFLAIFSYTRSSEEIVENSILELMLSFFSSQSITAFNIGYAVDFKSYFPDWGIYSLGTIYHFFRDNVFSSFLFNTSPLPSASTQLATEGLSFGSTLTYLVNPSYYYSGGGLGSNFIAELWVDFGITGVITGSAIYGLIMSISPQWIYKKGPIFLAYFFLSSLNIIYSPRAEFAGFISPFFSITTLFTYVILNKISKK